MATTERRSGACRRGMTVLGKVPVTPKPLNSPSQRSPFSCGNAGRFLSSRLSGKFESALLNPESSAEKLETGVDCEEKKVQSLPATARADSCSSGVAAATIMASNNVLKVVEPRKCPTCNSFESWKQELDPPLQKGGDGSSGGVTIPPGFSPSGAHGNNSRLGLSSTDSQCNCANGTRADPSQQNGTHSGPGMPYRTGTKDREIIVIHMVGGPGFYGNYPPQIGFPERYNRNGGPYGSLPLQFGNFEPFFGLQGHGQLDGGAQLSAGSGSGFFDEHEGFICYEKECYQGGCHGRHRNGWARGSYSENSFLGGRQGGDVYDSLMPHPTPMVRSRPFSQRFSSRNAGRSRSLYRNGRLVPLSMEESTAEPVSEKRITLLTKVSQHDILVKNSLKEVGDKNALDSDSSAYLNEEFDDDEGKAPIESFEAKKVTEDIQVETNAPAGVSAKLEKRDETTMHEETALVNNKVSSLKTSCNDECLHCKDDAIIRVSPSLCQTCEKTTVCESTFSPPGSCMGPTEEVPVASLGKDSCVDGCKAEEKHVILDADKNSTNTIKSEAVSREQEIALESCNSSITSESGDAEASKVGTTVSSDASFKKAAVKLAFKKRLQSKSVNKPGIRVGKAHVAPRKPGLQGVKMQQEDAVQKSSPPLTSQLNPSRRNSSSSSHLNQSKFSEIDTSLSSVAASKKNTRKQQKLFYKRRTAEQSAIEFKPSRNSSKFSQPVKSLSATSQAEVGAEHEKTGGKPIASASEYHIVRSRVCNVVEGSKGDYYAPTASLPTSDRDQLSSKRHLEKAKEKTLPSLAAFSHRSEAESLLVQRSGSDIECRNSCFEKKSLSAIFSVQSARSSLFSSRQGNNTTNKYAKSCRPNSAWKPKVACQTEGSGNVCSWKEKEVEFAASAFVEEVHREKTSSLCSHLVGALGDKHTGRSICEKHLVGASKAPSFEQKGSSSGLHECAVDDQILSQQESSLAREGRAGKLLDSMVSKQDVERGSVQAHAKEMPPVRSSDPMAHDDAGALALEQDKQACNQESTAGNCRPFIKKSRMSREKADRYHQILFKRYKETGQWRPKADLHKKSLKHAGGSS